MCLNSFLKASKGNNRISKSRAFHNVGAAHTKDLSKNELVVLLTLSVIKSHKYYGAVLSTALCVKSKILKIILS